MASVNNRVSTRPCLPALVRKVNRDQPAVVNPSSDQTTPKKPTTPNKSSSSSNHRLQREEETARSERAPGSESTVVVPRKELGWRTLPRDDRFETLEEPDWNPSYKVWIYPNREEWLKQWDERHSLGKIIDKLRLDYDKLSRKELCELILGPRITRIPLLYNTHKPLPKDIGFTIVSCYCVLDREAMSTSVGTYWGEEDLKNYITGPNPYVIEPDYSYSDHYYLFKNLDDSLREEWETEVRRLSGEDLVNYLLDEHQFMTENADMCYLTNAHSVICKYNLIIGTNMRQLPPLLR